MLTHLTISNFALVTRLDLSFEPAMSVITGETGAGKSIMLDALGLTLGNRAEPALIAPDADRAEILSCFDVSAIKAARVWLAERELESDDHNVILRRTMTKDGRSRGFINGVPVNLGDMKSLGNLLIDIHSQHEHQSLLKKETHRRLLDEYGGLTDQANEVARLADGFKKNQLRLDHLVESSAEQTARLQLLTYQVEELEQLALESGETERLGTEQKQLAHAEEYLARCQQAIALINPDDDASVVASLGRAVSLLSALDDNRLRPIVDLFNSGLIQLEEASHDLDHYVADYEVDPARLAQVEDRLDDIYNIARKHRIDPAGLADLALAINAELKDMTDAGSQIAQLEAEQKGLRDQYQVAAALLSGGRQKASVQLTHKVSQKLKQLGMTGARFEIGLVTHKDSALHIHGAEDVEFLIASNPGQPAGPLNKIASGGELSRISLAIQVVTAKTSAVPTLIFDEVDVGIGGAIAEIVGGALRALGKNAQIICVTHLAQVAAQGNHHYKVVKEGSKRANTQVFPLQAQEKVEEIARMLGGIEQTDQSIAHAQEMFSSAQK